MQLISDPTQVCSNINASDIDVASPDSDDQFTCTNVSLAHICQPCDGQLLTVFLQVDDALLDVNCNASS